MKNHLTTLQEKMREKYMRRFGIDDDWDNRLYGYRPTGLVVVNDEVQDFLSQAISTAYEQGVKDVIKTLAHRIDCNTVISELYGWKSIVEMSEDEALKELLIHTK